MALPALLEIDDPLTQGKTDEQILQAFVRKYEIKAIQRTVEMDDLTPLVFQYGSNCSESEINSKNRLCGAVR